MKRSPSCSSASGSSSGTSAPAHPDSAPCRRYRHLLLLLVLAAVGCAIVLPNGFDRTALVLRRLPKAEPSRRLVTPPPATAAPLPPTLLASEGSSIPPDVAPEVPRLEAGNLALRRELRAHTVLGGSAVIATAANYGFREFLLNVALTTYRAYPGVKLVAAMLDEKAGTWCPGGMPHSLCVLHPCSCRSAAAGVQMSADGYSSCLGEIYVCKLKVQLALLRLGFSVFFIDADAAIRPNALSFVEGLAGKDIVGACEACSGACEIHGKQQQAVDRGAKNLPVKYTQVNVGLAFFNKTETMLRALEESVEIIVQNQILHFVKSIDQTTLNRRLMAAGAAVHCLRREAGGLNTASRSSRPGYFPDAWGVHAARLVAKNNFYKKAFLEVNHLWLAPGRTEEFLSDVAMWRDQPRKLKKKLEAAKLL